jgi:HPt (histidine-containing phosphotransfer) domain-containing protein
MNSFIKERVIKFDHLQKTIGEMIGDESPQKIQSLLIYLLEEISYARHQWEISLKEHDWDLASKIFHREKLFINTLDIFKQSQLVAEIQKNPHDFKITEVKKLYAEMIELFKKIENLIIQNNGKLPV